MREWVPTPRKSFLGPGQGAGQESREWVPTPWLGFLVPDRFLLLSGVSFLVAVLWGCRSLFVLGYYYHYGAKRPKVVQKSCYCHFDIHKQDT